MSIWNLKNEKTVEVMKRATRKDLDAAFKKLNECVDIYTKQEPTKENLDKLYNLLFDAKVRVEMAAFDLDCL